MYILGKSIIEEFKRKHANSRKALDRWVKLVEGANFDSPRDLKQMFGVNVDFVGRQTIFDVGGNKIRAITKVAFGQRIILITHVLSHAEYDRDRWKE